MKKLLALVAALLCLSGCWGEREEIEGPFLIGVTVRPPNVNGDAIDGLWTSATEVRFGEADAANLSVPEIFVVDARTSAPSLTVRVETGLTEVEDQPLGFCLEDDLMLVDSGQGIEHVIAEAGYCFNQREIFELSAAIDPT